MYLPCQCSLTTAKKKSSIDDHNYLTELIIKQHRILVFMLNKLSFVLEGIISHLVYNLLLQKRINKQGRKPTCESP